MFLHTKVVLLQKYLAGVEMIYEKRKNDLRNAEKLTAMICNDIPFAIDLAEDERVMTTEISDRSFQHPFADNEIVRIAQAPDLQDVEEQLSHLRCIGIAFFIILQRVVVSVGNAILTDKHQCIVFPVAFHECIEVSFVPGFRLFSQYSKDLAFVLRLGEGIRESKTE